MLFEYPSVEDWNRLAKEFQVERLQVRLGDFQVGYDPSTAGPRELFVRLETQNWERHLQGRISDAWTSFILLLYYYYLGIPDDEWSRPLEEGGIEYFPHFDRRDHQIKDQFDFYTDVFYYKIFTAWDTIGQLIFLIFQLRQNVKEKPSFALAISRLKDGHPALYDSLSEITANSEFQKAREYRNDITHNFKPNTLGSSARMPDENSMTFGGADYTPSRIFKDNVAHTLDLFAQTLERIKSYLGT